uniref:Adenosinetriphosphatase n=1 Tax=Opuntia streptacantha TaxID=393608 RepID=A0A7C9EDU0_OPUST
MVIPAVKDQIPSPFENGMAALKIPDGKNGIFLTPELPCPPTLPTICTDANAVPEHTESELDQLVTNLEEEIVALSAKHKCYNEKRRGLLNKILDIKGSIRVFCRIRPFSWSNGRRNEEPILADSQKIVVKSAGSKKEFDFDKVFCENSKQEDVFLEVEPILRSALDGHNVCVLAYGQTGTGKTFTMEGTKDQPGVVPRALKELFMQASLENSASVTFSISMLEVYMGNLKDLLAERPVRRVYEPISRCNLNIQVDAKGGVEIEGLTEVPVSDFKKAIWWYNKGRRARATSFTNVNDASSRSHCLTRITISHHGEAAEGETRVSKLWMVDLGGSERLLKTGAKGLTLDEGRAINLSLSALGDVIAALRRRRSHVPYRNSKLTQILRDSLGNGSKVLMLVHISPYEEDLAETVCSISFAKRARAVESNHELPQDIRRQRENRILELSKEMREAEEECLRIKNQLKKAEFLLAENKRLRSGTCKLADDEENTPESAKSSLKEVVDSPDDPEKATRKKSLPHFMISTVASRHRQSSVDRETHFTARVLRSGTRSSMHLSASQSLSFLDSRLKTVLRNRNTMHNDKSVKEVLNENPNCNTVETKPSSMPCSKTVACSHPNTRTTFPRHRRRMSDLI